MDLVLSLVPSPHVTEQEVHVPQEPTSQSTENESKLNKKHMTLEVAKQVIILYLHICKVNSFGTSRCKYVHISEQHAL